MAVAAKEIGIQVPAIAPKNWDGAGADTLAKWNVWLNKPICKAFRITKTFDTHEFQKKIITKRVLENNLSIDEAAKQIGISKSTYGWLERG